MEQPIRGQGQAAQQLSAPMADSRALVIDLERALLRCSLFQEALFSDPVRSFACLRNAIPGGRDALFEQVLTTSGIDYAHLPYEPDVLNLGLAARAQGRRIYIAATRFLDHAAAIASHLGFDGVVSLADVCAGIETKNTGAPVLAFDAGNFDYIGNGQAPESVWHAASTIYVVGGSDRLLRRLQ